MFIKKSLYFLVSFLGMLLVAGCGSKLSKTSSTLAENVQSNGTELLVVDCLLPGQLRKLGQVSNYLTARRPIKTTAVDCEIRGGEYVVYDRADYKTALAIWLPQAQQDNPVAQNYVGEIYEKGFGLVPDYKVAYYWYKKAAEKGYSQSQINLGYLYEKGLGVEKDLVTALNWYRKASGLEDDDIAFASTIETAVKAEYQNELNILRNELDQSQLEISKLQSKLSYSRKKFHREQSKLSRLRANLDRTKTELAGIKTVGNATVAQQKITEYEEKLQSITAQTKQQLQVAEKAKLDLSQYNKALSEKLEQAESRSAQLTEELVKQEQEEGLLKSQLINLQSQLASSKLSIAQLSDNLLSEQHKINEGKKELMRLKGEAGYKNNSELSALKAKLSQRDKELKQHYQLKATLEKEKLQLKNEKLILEADKHRALAEKNSILKSLNEKLRVQNEALLKQNSRIGLLETENNKALRVKKQLEQNQSTVISANGERIAELELLLKKQEKSFSGQRSKIQSLQKDKLEYEKKIKKLQVKKQQKVAFAKPSIEILEPPFTITRSNNIPTVKLRSAMSHREITGRVIAPAGLLSLNVNGVKEDVNDSGIFSSLIALKDKETLVKAVAIDNSGKKAELDFLLKSVGSSESLLAKDKKKPVKNIIGTMSKEVDFGPYHALIIGNQNYKQFGDLDTPINDAKTIANILKNKYGFKTKVLINASRYDILSSLNDLRSKLTETDNLLIYYAGHGELDRVNMRGHWLPVDAESNNTANWISTIAITDILNAMSAKHVLVVADSCYSGAMTRSSLARLEAGMSEKLRLKWLKLMSKTRSRTVLTSGGLKPVLDSGLNGHSIFANAFIDAIDKNSSILEGQKLYRKIFDNLIQVTKRLNFKQEPQYAPIRHGGHEAGDFFLVRRNR